MDTWYEIQARSGSRDLWVMVAAKEKPTLLDDPWRLPDGTDVWELVNSSRLDAIPYPVWFEVVPTSMNRGDRRGDMLWTTGPTTIVSERMLAVLKDIGAAGYETFPADVRERSGEAITGYTGLLVTSDEASTDIKTMFGFPNFTFLVSPRVVTALRSAGVTEMSIRKHDPAVFEGI